MDIKKFIMSDKINNNYNKTMQQEIDTLRNHTNGNINNQYQSLYSISDLDFLELCIDYDDFMDDSNISDFIASYVKENEYVSNICFGGPMIKRILSDKSIIKSKKVSIKNYYTVCVFGNKSIKDIIKLDDNHKSTNGVYKININDTIFYLEKKEYQSPSHAILSKGAIDRIMRINSNIWVSGMFILELYKCISLFGANDNIDPVYGYPQDVLDIFDRSSLTKEGNIKSIIDMVDLDKLQEIKVNKLTSELIPVDDQKLTVLEYVLLKIMENNHTIIIHQYRVMIHYLSNFSYIRPIFFFAQLIGFDKKFSAIYETLKDIKNKIIIDPSKVSITNLKTVYHIDMFIINHLIKGDDDDAFIEYTSKVGIIKKFKSLSKTADKIIDWVIEHKAMKIINSLIDCKLLCNEYKFKIILLTQELDLLDDEIIECFSKIDEDKSTDTIFDDNDQEIILELIPNIIKNGLTRSFYFVYKMLENIITEEINIGYFDHIISDSSLDIMELLLKINPSLLNKRDSLGKTLLIKFAELGLYKIVIKLIDLEIDFDAQDNNGDTFIHKLCANGHLQILQNVIRGVLNLLNIQNNQMMTPSIVACQKGHEEIFYVLKGLNADMNVIDIYGNTVYHYICLNKICPNILVVNKKNKYGFTPYDYCKISPKYYYFQEGP